MTSLQHLLDNNTVWAARMEAQRPGFFKSSADVMSCNLCSLQTAIYESRKKATLIPDWMHRKTREKLQRFEDSIAGITCQGDGKT